jgi:asparagine synthase (glutamine-hydrolysing)
MCGIAGFWGITERAALTRLKAMTDAVAHRGPDGQACWVDGAVGLGHTRLAIIDLEGGDQPMWDHDQRRVIVFNGEIYNYRELRDELAAAGFQFRTLSDTEVIAAAIAAWGVESGLRRLRGMFAFGLYDTVTDTLLLARDRVGIKPLYYAPLRDGLLFGSEQKALLASGLLERRANSVAIHDYLAQGYATTPHTCWAEIRMLEPGAWLEIGPNGIRHGSYWRWEAREDTTQSFEDVAERTRAVLRDALRCHIISDVPVAAFLSGGLDSALNVALLADGLLPGIQTFTMSFADPAYDESAVARGIAASLRTRHREIRMSSSSDDFDLFVRIVSQYDEPFGDSSCLPTYLICREMRRHVKVAISGDGGDEVLGGYIRHLRARQLAALAWLRPLDSLLTPALAATARWAGRGGQQAAKAWQYARLPRSEMLWSLPSYFSEQERREFYQPAYAAIALEGGATATRFADLVPADQRDPVKQLIAAEFRLRLHADYLRKVDVASSAHGLEVRVPYLDNDMLELSMSLPTRFRIDARGHTKLLARRISRDLLPASVVSRRKTGFSVPLDDWLGPGLRSRLADMLLDPSARLHQFIRRDAVAAIWRSFAAPTGAERLSRFQRYQRAFLLVSLEIWLQRWSPTL